MIGKLQKKKIINLLYKCQLSPKYFNSTNLILNFLTNCQYSHFNYFDKRNHWHRHGSSHMTWPMLTWMLQILKKKLWNFIILYFLCDSMLFIFFPLRPTSVDDTSLGTWQGPTSLCVDPMRACRLDDRH